MKIGKLQISFFKDIAYNGILPKFRLKRSLFYFRCGASFYFFKYVLRFDYTKRNKRSRKCPVLIVPAP